jgi:hypothetical protein
LLEGGECGHGIREVLEVFKILEAVAKLQFSTAIIPEKCFGSL